MKGAICFRPHLIHVHGAGFGTWLENMLGAEEDGTLGQHGKDECISRDRDE